MQNTQSGAIYKRQQRASLIKGVLDKEHLGLLVWTNTNRIQLLSTNDAYIPNGPVLFDIDVHELTEVSYRQTFLTLTTGHNKYLINLAPLSMYTQGTDWDTPWSIQLEKQFNERIGIRWWASAFRSFQIPSHFYERSMVQALPYVLLFIIWVVVMVAQFILK